MLATKRPIENKVRVRFALPTQLPAHNSVATVAELNGQSYVTAQRDIKKTPSSNLMPSLYLSTKCTIRHPQPHTARPPTPVNAACLPRDILTTPPASLLLHNGRSCILKGDERASRKDLQWM